MVCSSVWVVFEATWCAKSRAFFYMEPIVTCFNLLSIIYGRMINNWLKNILKVVYPHRCALCGASGFQNRDLCRDCYEDLPFNHNACRICAIPLPFVEENQNLICGHCQQQARHFDTCQSLLIYRSPIDKLIHQLKFQHRLHLASLLGKLMAEELSNRLSDLERLPECIIPVPLHASRLRGRGYNQALELAKPIAKQLNLPLLSNSCVRNKATLPQSDLPAEERFNNVKGGFTVQGDLSARHVAIVDDVMTTGSTLDAIAKALKASGVQTVDVWICARAQRH